MNRRTTPMNAKGILLVALAAAAIAAAGSDQESLAR